MCLMHISGQWITSAEFWAPAGVLLLSTAVLTWVGFKAASPKQRLVYGMSTVTLLNHAPGLRDKIKVTWGEGEPLTHPHVVRVKVVNGGRRDIPSDAFNDREPLEFDLGARVIAPLENGIAPRGPHGQQWETEGTRLKIWPRLIRQGGAPLSFPLLVDGPQPKVTLVEPHPLINIKVRKGNPDLPTSPLGLLKAAWGDPRGRTAVVAQFGAVAAGVATVLTTALAAKR